MPYYPPPSGGAAVTASASNGSFTAGLLAFSNANNVTFGTSAGSIITASISPGGAGDGVNILAAGTQTAATTGTVLFNNSNGITFGMSNSSVITASYNSTQFQSTGNYLTTAMLSNAVTLSNIRVSGGTTSNLLSAITFADSNGVSFGLNAGTMTATVKTDYLTSQSNQNVTAANGGFAFQTLSFSNVNGISFGTSAGSAITASHNAITTARASTDAIGLNTAQSNVTWTVNSSGISFDARGYAGTGFSGTNISGTVDSKGVSLSVAAPGGGGFQSAGFSTQGNTAGDTGFASQSIQFVGGNNITLSGSTNAGGVTMTISGANAGGAQTGISGIQVSNTTYTSGTVTWQNANGISFGSSGANGISASYTVPTVTNSSWTVSDNASSATVGRLAFTNLNGVTLSLSTGAAGSHTIVGSHNALTSQSNQNVTAANGGFAFQTLSFSNVNGMSFGTSAGSAITGSYTVPTVTDYFSKTNTTFNGANISGSITLNTAGLQLSMSVAAPGGGVNPVASASNGSFSFTTLNFSNANNVTFGTSAGSIITASVAAPGAAAENNWVNLLGANTAGNTTASGSTIGYSGINLTLSGTNGSVVNISAPATSSLSATGAVSLSTNGSTISIGVPNPYLSFWNNLNKLQLTTVGQQANNSASIIPFDVNQNITATRFEVPVSMNVGSAANNSSAAVNYTMSVLIATLNGATLSTLSSTNSNTGTTWSSNNTSNVTGAFFLSAPLNANLTVGRYYAIVHLSTAATGNVLTGAATTSLANTLTMIGAGTAQFGAFSFRNFTQGGSNSTIGMFNGGLNSSTGNLTQISMSNVSQAGTFGQRGGGIGIRFQA